MLHIQGAREQWETDTSYLCVPRTLELKMDELEEFVFHERPVSSITYVKYYDQSNTLQTLSTDVYALDTAKRKLSLKYMQAFPGVLSRWDAVTVRYVAGDTFCSPMAKRAMLMLIGYYFEQRGDNDKAYDLRAYQKIRDRFERPSYP